MKLTHLKTLTAVGALVLGLTGYATSSAHAQSSEVVTATLTTSTAISTTLVDDIAYGEWMLLHGGTSPADDFVLRMSADGTNAITVENGLGDSQAIEIDIATALSGLVDVDVPAGPTDLALAVTAINDFTDPGLAVEATAGIRWRTVGTGTTNTAPFSVDPLGTVTTDGNGDASVRFGLDIEVTDTPADAIHTADFEVEFSY